MILNLLVLFLATFLGGVLISFSKVNSHSLRLPLIFAGSFLFAITVIHILPELYTSSDQPMSIGVVVLVGFFFQQLLETFTSGVEHGHFHKDDHISGNSKLGLFVALMIHSLLEGSLLNHESPFHEQHDSHSLLLGIVFHKVPAAFALMAVITNGKKPLVQDWLLLLLFSISSPAGLLIANYAPALPQDMLLVLFAFVSGSFLHISTTIFVESSPNHQLGWRKVAISLCGALLAVGVEHFA